MNRDNISTFSKESHIKYAHLLFLKISMADNERSVKFKKMLQKYMVYN